MRIGRVRELIFGPAARSPALPRRVRAALHGLAGADIHRSAAFGPRTYVRDYTQLRVGAGSWVGPECYLESHAPVTLGSNVSVAARCVLATASHQMGGSTKRAGSFYCLPITIEDGAWLGASVTVLPGVTIGHGAVVAAGSVVIKDCEPDTLYAGVPAVAKKRLSDLPVRA